MGPLTRQLFAPVAALMLVVAAPAHADRLAAWRGHIAEASARFGVPVAWIERVMLAESGGRTMLSGRPITSSAGAMGLMQLMPATWADMRRAYGLGTDPYQPRDNILAGVAYLRLMYDRFGYPGCLAAYNAGPARYADHLASGRALPAETIAYLAMTSGGEPPSRAVEQLPVKPRQGLFVALRTRSEPTTSPSNASDNRLFAPLGRPEIDAAPPPIEP